ncbi:MAG TPA: IS1595 family transposase [Rhizomicrobium sp.]|nr:IS1595 family transposase [Rhizomicrobium sp.]
MSQHFLLSAKPRTLSLATIARMTEEQARDTFRKLRWADNDGEPYCPKCGCLKVTALATRPVWKCSGCKHQFSVTSGTIFADRKRPVRDYLLAIAIFANGAKGHSALQLSRDLDCQYKTAYVLAHKMREAMAAEQAKATIAGTCEIDGAYFGGTIRKKNVAAERIDRRVPENQPGTRKVVVVIRERKGRTLPFVFNKESEAVPTIRALVPFGATIHADESRAWDVLHAHFDMKRINHSEAYSRDGACSNQAESFFSRLRRSEFGIHHRISGKYLGFYSSEMAWREDRRRVANGAQFQNIAATAITHPMSRNWRGYWNRSAA